MIITFTSSTEVKECVEYKNVKKVQNFNPILRSHVLICLPLKKRGEKGTENTGDKRFMKR